ncbi:type ISP restriction/modification enzyme [Bacillus sp. JJ864]|uniref:type ISP restriction/modification enzyme n=1 Tax=Bacillus sp. JJ864 TaxID=3122975 RepID=UPI002FFED4A8
MHLNAYLNQIAKRYSSGISKEHSYRGDLENLLRNIAQGVEITNEPANVTDCGNPDYVITKGKIPIGYIEAKDIGKDLNSKIYKEQFERYKTALDNLIITDYIWFQFYRQGELTHEIQIGEIKSGKIIPLTKNYDEFYNLIQEFCNFIGQTIKSPKKLAEMMASKARLLENTLEKAITSDEKSQENTSLKDQYESFRQILIHDLQPKEFADIYAQTLAYGMFAARLHDTKLDEFTRQEAAELIPKTNPFLRKLFQYVAGYDIDERIRTTVDNLAEVFRATDVSAILNNFGESTQTTDPIIHFYETFLAAYDPKLRKARGVYYTPEPVVNFIVRAVNELLENDFGLSKGLADTSKTKIKREVTGVTITKGRNKGKAIFEEIEVPKVQILDPATGTGTFLSEVIKYIYNNNFKSMQGAWSSYVEDHLIPRLNGFEILMASYSMAHLKLDMLLTETKYIPKKEQRFNIYLTNSLEEHHPDTGTLFASWLSNEANEANFIKRDTPVMCVIGNPPYSVSSSNKSAWIEELMSDYKKGLNEKNINPLSDDYLKFIRHGQHFIDKNGEGILAFISNNSFIDGIIHKQVRRSLLESFDKIYILDLHGSANKQETSPDGSPDQNVFDIMQGVSINIFIKTTKVSKKLADLYHYDLFGKREHKYNLLSTENLSSIPWSKLSPKSPDYFFIPKNYDVEKDYKKGISVADLFLVHTTGIQTHRDGLVVDFDKEPLSNRIKDFYDTELSNSEIVSRYSLKEKEEWLNSKRKGIFEKEKIRRIAYRPFDNKYIYYSNDLIDRPRGKVMSHILEKDNIIALFPRQAVTEKFGYFISRHITDRNYTGTAAQYGAGLAFPLYLYNETTDQQAFGENTRIPNLNSEIFKKIEKKLKLKFTYEKEETLNTFAPIDILDYIYAYINSKNYCEKYIEFLKIDFPRVPHPKNKKFFWDMVKLGSSLRELHLMETTKIEELITRYPNDGNNQIIRKIVKNDWEIIDQEKQLGRIWINEDQYFENIPIIAWEFTIGGYQPAQKWLKDRIGRELTFEDILYYQKIIVALTESDKIIREIDKTVK